MASRYPRLLSPLEIGSLRLPNRVAMAPMTRSRAGADRAPTALTAEYYRQRATAGLIITEAASVSPQGVGYLGTPGIWNDAQQAAWKRVNDVVHAAGGRIFAQLWHVGRISHTSFQPGGAHPVSSSSIAAKGQTWTAEGQQPFSVPRALETLEITDVVKQYEEAARRAKAAGFDGIELHGANGYLIDQFLRDGVNHRTDTYGGSVGNRARFLLEVLAAVQGVWGPDRVAVRISPTGGFNDMSDSDPVGTFTHVVRELKGRRLAFLHVIEALGGPFHVAGDRITPRLREAFGGPLMLNGGYLADTAEAALASGEGDLVSFGVPFLANPDLPERFRAEAALNAADNATFYGGSEKGYTDYPVLAASF